MNVYVCGSVWGGAHLPSAQERRVECDRSEADDADEGVAGGLLGTEALLAAEQRAKQPDEKDRH